MSRSVNNAARFRFSVGQRVTLSGTRLEKVAVAGDFKVTAQLPHDGGEHQYRVKHDREAFERRVGEYRLILAA
jgi:hypothetical protein